MSLAIALLLAPDPGDRIEVQTETKKPARTGKVVILKGLHKLLPTAPADNIPLLQVPLKTTAETGGIFSGKLKRNRKAKLSVRKPQHKGIGLMAGGGASFVPLYMYSDPGIYFSPDRGQTALVLAPGLMDGDDLRVECKGTLPPALDLFVLYRSPSGTQFGASSRLRVSGNEVRFILATDGFDDGILLASLTSPKGQARVEQCTVKRTAP